MDIIADIDKNRYILLKKGLKHIDPSKNDWEVLLDMELEGIVDCDDYDIELLEPLCKGLDKSGTGHHFRCVCGKHPLKHLAIIKYKNGKRYTLGSVCIKELEAIMELEEQDIRLREKISKWINYIKAYNLKRLNKPCIVCGAYKITKKTGYKDKRRNHRCNNCIQRYFVKCMDCKCWFPHKRDSPFHKPRCGVCYHNRDNLDFLSDSDSE
jgi:hypothetical protein